MDDRKSCLTVEELLTVRCLLTEEVSKETQLSQRSGTGQRGANGRSAASAAAAPTTATTQHGHWSPRPQLSLMYSMFFGDNGQTEVDDTRRVESNTARNFAMIRRSLQNWLSHYHKALLAETGSTKKQWSFRFNIQISVFAGCFRHVSC